MDSNHIGRLRKNYLRVHHTLVYNELRDDGVLDAHIRHVVGRALALYEKLLATGDSCKTAEDKVLREVIAPSAN